jgi:hypothetical protein
MIVFKQMEFSEYDAMRSLYVELMRYSDNRKFEIIGQSSLIPILKGNNIVIERFVISTSFFGKDRYRMYLKIGARAKMPDEVRLPNRVYDKRIGNLQLNVNSSVFAPDYRGGDGGNNNGGGNAQPGNENPGGNGGGNNNGGGNGRRRQKNHSGAYDTTGRLKLFADNGKKKGPPPFLSASMSPYMDLTVKVQELLGDAIVYDKKSRTLVLEFDSIRDAIQALNILPFGLNYKIYLLDA